MRSPPVITHAAKIEPRLVPDEPRVRSRWPAHILGRRRFAPDPAAVPPLQDRHWSPHRVGWYASPSFKRGAASDAVMPAHAERLTRGVFR